MTASFEMTVTGIPLWLLQEYLESLGGWVDTDGQLRGPGWQARLAQVEDYQIGSLRVGRVRLELHGPAEAVEKLRPAIEKKLVRAGG